ncbi:MAG TPA: Ppx/GppA phosphatase family protein [Vicinamibacteria bacterium]|nr:Ppx/GppA phosphatase family protein [Vicinamibacteria bacterium]
MASKPRRRTLTRKPAANAPPPPPEPPRPFAVVDLGASAVRLVVAEVQPGAPHRVLEEASRGVLLGKDTFTHGRLGAATVEATLKVLEGFRKIMDTYGVVRYRAVATSAIREAGNRETFLDRVRLRTGIEMEVIDGTEENRLTYMAVRETLRDDEALSAGDALLLEVGGGSADLSFLRKGQPIHSGTYALGAIRMRQNLASWHGNHEQRVRLLRRHIHNVVEDIRREMPLREAKHFVALGGDVRFAAENLASAPLSAGGPRILPREAFLAFCDEVMGYDLEQVIERFRLPPAEAETLVPALLVNRELLLETSAEQILAPEASLRQGLLLDLARAEEGRDIEDLSNQVLASAHALGEKYRFDAAHAKNVAYLATRLFDELKVEHGLGSRERLLVEVAALLHDIGNYVNLRAHHKHSQYILSVSDIFGLSRDDMDIVANVARYHRRATPQKSHLPYMALDSDTRVTVNKLAAVLRLANALDADHLQKVKEVRVKDEEGTLVIEVEGAGDLTMERLTAQSRGDFLTEVFGRRLSFREGSRS